MASAADDNLPGDEPPLSAELRETPRHGFRGERPRSAVPGPVPAGLTVAVSRESGSRGNTIGSRAGLRLGWPVYNQELLEHTAQESPFRQNVLENLAPDSGRWAEGRLQTLLREQTISQHPAVMNLARIILSLGAQGDMVLIGRGAGCILSRETTLHVRIVAPLADRVAYMSQWLRLTVEEAADQVRLRDRRRADFLGTHFHRQPADVYQYDLLLNSSLLGEDLCAELIVQAARAKRAAWERLRGSSPTGTPDPVR
jgi:hypothetical protein